MLPTPSPQPSPPLAPSRSISGCTPTAGERAWRVGTPPLNLTLTQPRSPENFSMLICILLAGLLAFDDDTIEPTVVGRPENFSGAVGAFRIQARCEPTTTQVEKPITLTLTVTARGVVGAAPEPPALDQIASLRDSFHLEPAES